MKITLVSLTALAAFAVVPIASQASDKEVVKGHFAHAFRVQHHQQVALSGSRIGENRAAPRMQTVMQVGQGQPVTFYAGDR